MNKPLHSTVVYQPISTGRQNAPDYLAYLQSPQWRAKRDRARKLAGYRCSRCPSKRDLQVHHLTYERLGAEWDSDLAVLCQNCHQAEHRANPDKISYGIYVVLAREALKENPLGDIADLSDVVKTLCAEHKIAAHPGRIAKALEVCGIDLKARPKEQPGDDRPQDVRPWSQAEARDLLSRFDGMGCLKSMPGTSAVVDQRAHEDRLAQQVAEMKDQR